MGTYCNTFWWLVLFLPISLVSVSQAKYYQGVLKDPIVLGGWLYKSKCVRCHQDYKQARLGANYDSAKELSSALKDGSCRISWDRASGGILDRNEIKALVTYILKWEEEDEEVVLPDLPPLALDVAKKPDALKAPEKKPLPQAASKKESLKQSLQKLIKQNSVAQGGWLYTNNCYRCHLSYNKVRMGKGMEPATLLRFITEGKTSTQMKPFSRLLGGNLKRKEILAIATYIQTWEKAGEDLAITEELMKPPDIDPADFKPYRLTKFKVIEGDFQSGQKLYIQNCSSCHGLHREGYLGTTLSKRLWTLRPDLYVKSIVKNGIPGTLMQGWDKSKGGQFPAKSIDDVVSYIVKEQEIQ